MILIKRFIPMFCFLVLTNLQVHTEDVFYLLPKGAHIFLAKKMFSALILFRVKSKAK